MVIRYPPTGQDEVSAAIISRRDRTAPGANESRNHAFKELPPVTVDIINGIIRFEHFPTIIDGGWLIMMANQGKNRKLLGNHRSFISNFNLAKYCYSVRDFDTILH